MEQPNQSLKSLVDQLVELNKAASASRSRKPYYHQRFVKEVKEILDGIAKTGKVVDVDFGSAPTTNRARFYQALQFLLEKEDPMGIYRAIRETININTTAVGVRVSPKREPAVLSVRETDTSWRNDLLAFLAELPPGSIFQRIGLPWTDEDIKWARDQVRACPESARIVSIINKTEMTIYCSPPEEISATLQTNLPDTL